MKARACGRRRCRVLGRTQVKKVLRAASFRVSVWGLGLTGLRACRVYAVWGVLGGFRRFRGFRGFRA